MSNLNALVRESIKKVKPYSSARDEFSGSAEIYLDANENSLGSPLLTWYNRYPDPHQNALKNKLSEIKQIDPQQIFLGNGSDECIDLLYRVFCEPGQDAAIICPPTYGMYEVSAAINNVQLIKANLLPTYQLDLETILDNVTDKVKIIWLCSPNNPTGNNLNFADIEFILNNFSGIVVVDEAYINFSRQKTAMSVLSEYTNLVVMQTLSKAWGLAGLRLGMAFASKEIIVYLNAIKPPYNINQATQNIALQALQNVEAVNQSIKEIVAMRQELEIVLKRFSLVEEVYPSDANFLLVKIKNAAEIYKFLLTQNIVVRDRSNVALCTGCLRITIGTEHENTRLVDALIEYSKNLNEI